MQFADNSGVRLQWRADGAGPALLLLNSVGLDFALWDGVMPALSGFRVIRMNARGHGGSDAPPGDYTLQQLAGDVICVMDAAGVERAAVCGLSLGGMTAMTLALAAPARVTALTLACTSAAVDRGAWEARVNAVRAGGLAPIADTIMERFFSEPFRRAHPDVVAATRVGFLNLDAKGYASCCAAIRDMELLGRIASIHCPTLVIGGTHDIATPYATHGAEIARRIPSARTAMVPAGHIAPMECPKEFAAALKAFITESVHA